MNENNELETVLKHPCFSSLSGRDINLILRNSTQLDFKKKETIIKQGNFSTHIYYVLEGLTKIFIEQNGKTKIIRMASHHRFIGLSHAFFDKSYHFSASAITPTKVLVIDKSVFKQLIKTNGEFAMNIIESMSLTSHRQIERMIIYTNKNIEGALATFLLHYAHVSELTKFRLPFSRKEISEIIGYSRESVIHTFTKFNKEGILKVTDKNIELIDLHTLRIIRDKG